MKKTGFKRKEYGEYKPMRRTPLRKVSLTPKKKKTNKRMIYGIRVWSLKVADSYFSHWLREKTPYCEWCGKVEGLTNSHYIGRKEMATRYDPENCDVFCWSCHAILEDRKQYEYRDWKISKMGQEAHEALRAKKNTTLGQKDAIFNCMKLLGKI